MAEQSNKEDKLILSRAEDAIDFAENKYQIKAVGFLNPHQRTLISRNIGNAYGCKCVFDGGYPDAERTVFVCCPEYDEYDIDDIVSVIEVTGRELGGLSHRDYLGSLMGLGITRENIGDILVSESGAFIFVKGEIADYIVQNLNKIGRHGINTKVVKCSQAKIPEPKYKELQGTVPSERLDAIVAFVAGTSRSKACELIEKGLVCVNWEVTENVSAKVCEGDLLSVRGVGRSRIRSFGGLTRKGRLSIVADRFE
ncbi:MAG: RNA-binding protein [Monoglobaceae bacterium]